MFTKLGIPVLALAALLGFTSKPADARTGFGFYYGPGYYSPYYSPFYGYSYGYGPSWYYSPHHHHHHHHHH